LWLAFREGSSNFSLSSGFSRAALPAIVTLAGTGAGSAALFPDLRGLGARDALRILARLGLIARVQGAGVVVDQEPAPGGPIERGSLATLRLDRGMSASP